MCNQLSIPKGENDGGDGSETRSVMEEEDNTKRRPVSMPDVRDKKESIYNTV